MTRRIGRWTCWSRPTRRPGCRRVQEAVFFAVANLLNLEVDLLFFLLFFDTTSTYLDLPRPTSTYLDLLRA
jgi:hypothetical protein